MAFRTLAVLVGLSLVAHACCAPPLVRDLADVKLNRAKCPMLVKSVTKPNLVPRVINTFECDEDLIRKQQLEDCMELEERVMFFDREGRPVLEPIKVACVLMPMQSSPAWQIGGE